jgi:hypothetical protein
MMAEKTKEEILTNWLQKWSSFRWAKQELREAEERLRLLEEYHHWLVEFPLRKADGSSFDIPEGPKVVCVSPAGRAAPRVGRSRRTSRKSAPPHCWRNQGGRPGKESCKYPLPPKPLLRRKEYISLIRRRLLCPVRRRHMRGNGRNRRVVLRFPLPSSPP